MNIEEAKTAIRRALVLALISGGVTLTLGLLSKYIKEIALTNVNLWFLLDAFIVFGLAFGIYKKNKICAVIMFIYFMISQLSISLHSGVVFNIPLAVIFLFYFYQGIRGIFSYHKLNDDGKSAIRN